MARKIATKGKGKAKLAAEAKPRKYVNIYKGRTRVVTSRTIRWVKEGAKDIVYNRKDMANRTRVRWAKDGAHKKQSKKMKAIHRAKKAAEAPAFASAA